MIKSKERTTEYCVIAMPRHRENPPICYKGYAKDEEEAACAVFNSDWHKEILDVKKSKEIRWNLETIKMYWNMYGNFEINKYDLKDNEIKLF